MTENKQFKIINDCGDYHLLDGDEQLGYDLCSYSMRKTNWNNVVDKLNEQDEEITGLKQRNKRQYERLKELTELMYERQWEKLENRVEEWEKQEELLQAEWGTYYEDK